MRIETLLAPHPRWVGKTLPVDDQSTAPALSFRGQKVRHVVIDGEPWFVAADACRCLDLTMAKGTLPHLQKLAPDERLTVRKGQNGPVSDTGAIFAGMENLHVLISEQGIYRLTMRSDKPMAKAMQDWVTREVLPSIRKTGGYLLNEEARETAAVSPSMPISAPQFN